MAEEEESSVTMTEQTVTHPAAPKALETQTSNEATIESNAQEGTNSTCNNNNNGETSAPASDEYREKSLEFAAELTEKGTKALKENDYGEAADCFSRALEIRLGFSILFLFLKFLFLLIRDIKTLNARIINY